MIRIDWDLEWCAKAASLDAKDVNPDRALLLVDSDSPSVLVVPDQLLFCFHNVSPYLR